MLNQVARYEPVAEAVLESSPKSILEVGSGSRGIEPYLAHAVQITACDITFDDYGASRVGLGARVQRVVGSVIELPFADASFDVVVAIDLLEHVNPADRERALTELVRVGRQRVVVGCPCGAAARASDIKLAHLHRLLHRALPRWLEEHLEHGLPESRELIHAMAPHGRVRVNLNDWLPAHRLIAGIEAMPGLWRLSSAAATLLAANFRAGGWRRRVTRWAALVLRGGDRRPAYRTIVILDKS